jgi:hypothetical protein
VAAGGDLAVRGAGRDTVLLPVFAPAARLPDGPLNSLLHVAAGGTLVWPAVPCSTTPASRR